MIHMITKYGKRVVYDTNSHKAHHLSPLAVKMIGSLTPPLREGCPSPLRYAFAKYDSGDLSEAYDSIYRLYKWGDLFAEEPSPDKEPEMTVINYGDEMPDSETVALMIPLDSAELASAVKEAEKDDRIILAPIADYSDEGSIAAATKIAEKLGMCGTCPTHKAKDNEPFSETVIKLIEKKFANISVLTESRSENTAAEYDKIMKHLVRSHNYATNFLPFKADYIRAMTKTDSENDTDKCAGCFARGICAGGHSGTECDTIRLQTECALINEAK